jgi:hypothetical protein
LYWLAHSWSPGLASAPAMAADAVPVSSSPAATPTASNVASRRVIFLLMGQQFTYPADVPV